MKVIFWGTPEYSVESLKNLLNSNHEIKAVITQPDKKRSRGKNLIPSPIKNLALRFNIPVLTPEKIKDNENFIKLLKSFDSDIFIVIAYGKILSKEILDIPKFGCWNAHASLLPRWRGAAPIQWSLLKGDKYTGIGIMKMDEGLDTGDLLLEKKIKIEEDDNLISLSKKLSILSSELINKSLEIINLNKENYNSELISQNKRELDIKYARMINKEDYRLILNNEAINIERKVRALFPKAFLNHKNKNLKILKIRLLKEKEINELMELDKIYYEKNKNEVGKVLKIYKNEGIVIATKTIPIVILEIKLEGKNITNKNQLIQQLNLKKGDEI